MTDSESQMAADRFAIQDVMLHYAAGVDERDMQMYRGCFADECDIVGFSDQTISGGDAWTAHVEQALKKYGATQHMLGPVLAVINGDEAQCRTDIQAMHYLVQEPGNTLTLWGTYRTQMRRISGQWKIVRHELIRKGTNIMSVTG